MFLLRLPPGSREHVRFGLAWTPLGDTCEVLVREPVDVLRICIGTENHMRVYAELAAGWPAKRILRMSRIDEARFAGFGVPYDSQTQNLVIKVTTRTSHEFLDGLSEDKIFSHPDFRCSNRGSCTKPSRDSGTRCGSKDEVTVSPRKITEADLNIAPVLPAWAFFASIVPPAINDAARVRVGALTQLEGADIGLESLCAPSQNVLIETNRRCRHKSRYEDNAEQPSECTENPSPHIRIRHRATASGRLRTFALGSQLRHVARL